MKIFAFGLAIVIFAGLTHKEIGFWPVIVFMTIGHMLVAVGILKWDPYERNDEGNTPLL